MNPICIAFFLCLGALVSGNPLEDGQWRGEGLAESQDNGQWNSGAWTGAWAPAVGAWSAPGAWATPVGSWAHGAAPLGPDGRVVDTPEVAQAKAAHLAAVNGAGAWAPAVGVWTAPGAWATPVGSWAHGAAPLGPDGRVVDTPEVAQAKAAHLAAVNGGSAWAPASAWGGAWAAPQGSWAHGAAPIGIDGRVVDTPEVAHAKAAHLAAKAAAGSW